MKIIDEKGYVDHAEKVIESLMDDRGRIGVTTSKIRNLLAMTMDIYNEILASEDELNDELAGRIEYLRVRMLYEAGRDPKNVKPFVEKAKLNEILKDIKTKKDYILYTRYMESLVAFHKYKGGKD